MDWHKGSTDRLTCTGMCVFPGCCVIVEMSLGRADATFEVKQWNGAKLGQPPVLPTEPNPASLQRLRLFCSNNISLPPTAVLTLGIMAAYTQCHTWECWLWSNWGAVGIRCSLLCIFEFRSWYYEWLFPSTENIILSEYHEISIKNYSCC